MLSMVSDEGIFEPVNSAFGLKVMESMAILPSEFLPMIPEASS